LALCCFAVTGASHAAGLLLTIPGQFANEGDALPPSLYDFDGDGRPEICSEDAPPASPLTTIRALNLTGTELWSRTFDVREYCPACDYGDFMIEGFAEIEDFAGKEVVLSFRGTDEQTWSDGYGVLVFSPATDQATTVIDSAYFEWLADFNGDGWDEFVIEYSDPTVGSFEVWGHGSTIGVGDATPAPRRTKVEANRPNPFNPETTIRFELTEQSPVAVEIHSVEGRLVRAIDMGRLQAGAHEVKWDGLTGSGSRAGSGAYFYTVVAGDERIVRKMILLR
jgi:hypothetical protein